MSGDWQEPRRVLHSTRGALAAALLLVWLLAAGAALAGGADVGRLHQSAKPASVLVVQSASAALTPGKVSARATLVNKSNKTLRATTAALAWRGVSGGLIQLERFSIPKLK